MAFPGPHIVVVGSINMDLVARVPYFPRSGETLSASDFFKMPGGKGANQAVALARLGADSAIIARVGDDVFGRELIDSLTSAGVDVSGVETTRCSSGLAFVSVNDQCENCITVFGGANARLSPEDITENEGLIASADALLVQLEVPVDTVATAVQIAQRYGVMTFLDPAPAPPDGLPLSLRRVDVVTPNEMEAAHLAGRSRNGLDDVTEIAQKLRNGGAACVIIKLGERGAFVCTDRISTFIPAPVVDAVDTTGAGDAFAAAVTFQLASRESLVNAVRFACSAGALTVTRLGAQAAMPSRSEVESFMRTLRAHELNIGG